MPSRTISEARIKATHEAAMAIIAAEKKRRDEKTARLRAQREAIETADGPEGTKASPRRRKRSAARPNT